MFCRLIASQLVLAKDGRSENTDICNKGRLWDQDYGMLEARYEGYWGQIKSESLVARVIREASQIGSESWLSLCEKKLEWL